jgi:hypothetical protein
VQVSSPVATNEFIVAVDGGVYAGIPQVSHLTGISMTNGSLVIGVPAGGPYRVRVISVDPRSNDSTFQVMNATGKAESVMVGSGSITDASVTLAQPSIALSATPTVSAGARITVSWTLQDPGASADRPSDDARVFYSLTPPTMYDISGSQTQATCTPSSGTTRQCSATITAPLTPGTIYLQVAHETFDLSLPGTSRAGWLIQPSVSRGESLVAIVVQ